MYDCIGILHGKHRKLVYCIIQLYEQTSLTLYKMSDRTVYDVYDTTISTFSTVKLLSSMSYVIVNIWSEKSDKKLLPSERVEKNATS